MKTIHDFLRRHTLRREEVDRFLDPAADNWGVFDSELGYVLRDHIERDGIDGSFTLSEFGPRGERRMRAYADLPCRINTYGDSYTQCQQASDCETWQEYLAGHFGEPIRNFGAGGYGVYQAYRRMARMEQTDIGAPFVMLGIFGVDDHWRSIDAFRRVRCGNWFEEHPSMFHANPWDFVRLDPATLELVEHRNLCPTPESLYNLCDADWMIAAFERDLAMRMHLARDPEFEVDCGDMRPVAEALGVALDLSSVERRIETVGALYLAYGLAASMRIVDKARAFCEGRGKKLFLVLFHGDGDILRMAQGQPRLDAPFIDHLRAGGFDYSDMLDHHARDWRQFNLSPGEYMRRYCIPHYNPLGNHFTAYSIKDAVAAWLDPGPRTSQDGGKAVHFDKYLLDAPERHANA